MDRLSRRAFIVHTGGLAASGLALLNGCVGAASGLGPGLAQGRQRVRIGYLSPEPPASNADNPFWPELAQRGWRRGDNLEVEYRWAYADTAAEMAAELVAARVQLILTQGEPQTRAAKDTTATIPIVMFGVGDAVAGGLVANLARPGGNITGLSMLNPEVAAKRLELLREIAPRITRVAVVWHPKILDTVHSFEHLVRAAQTLSIDLRSLEVAAPEDMMRNALAAITPGGTEGLVVSNAASYWLEHDLILQTVAQQQVPTIYPSSSWVRLGGLISYGPADASLYRQAAVQVDKVLRGVPPADIPVEQPRSFDCSVNSRTAQTLRLTISPALRAVVTELVQ